MAVKTIPLALAHSVAAIHHFQPASVVWESKAHIWRWRVAFLFSPERILNSAEMIDRLLASNQIDEKQYLITVFVNRGFVSLTQWSWFCLELIV